MMDLTFGEQVKIILSRKGMTIKELAETIEERTGKKMSRQNLTQRLGRDNFQEQDMRMIAAILECPFYLNILDEEYTAENNSNDSNTIQKKEKKPFLAIEVEEQKPEEIDDPEIEREITVGELVDIHESLDAIEEVVAEKTAAEEVEEELPEAFYDDEEEEMVDEVGDNDEGLAFEPLRNEDKSDIAEEAEEYAVEDLLAEMDAIEQEEEERKREKESREQKNVQEAEKKSRGWKSYLHFGKKKNVEEIVYEEQEEELAEEAETDVQYEETQDEIEETEAYSQEEESQNEEYSDEAYEDETVEEAVSEEEDDSDAIYLDDDEEMNDDGMIESDDDEEDLEVGDVNPYTGKEYESNSVRMHPKRIGYVQVYDRSEHKWADMTEWAFLGYQERKKALLGKDYEPPIYLD